MKKDRTWLLVAALIALSASIYGLQIRLFHDVRTTEFYILQDLAFVPLSFAVTTVVVGEIMDAHEKRDSIRKTRMLTSSFFTAIGAGLLSDMMEISETKPDLTGLLAQTEKEVKEKQRQILDEYRERYSKNVDIKQELKPSLTLQDMSAEILLTLSSVKTQTKHIILVLNGTDVGTITLQYQTIIQGGRPQFAYDTCYLSHPKLTTYWSLKSSNMDFSGDKIGVYFSFVYGIFQDHAWVYFKPD